MNIGERIKNRRKELKMSADVVAEKLGVSRSTIFRYEKGDIEKLPTNILDDISEILETTPAYLMGWDTQPEIEKENIITIYEKLSSKRRKKVYDFAKTQLEEQNKVVQLDHYKDIEVTSKVSAGKGIVDLEPEYTETIRYNGELPRHYDMAFQVAGNSMEPIFQDGDIIFVECQPDAINGALMVVQVDDEAFVKKVYIDGSTLRLVSLNKEYDDIYIDKHENVKIIGKVVF